MQRAPAQQGELVPFCRGCGVVAPVHGTTCEVCGGALASTRLFTVPSDVHWVAVRASFTCRSCGFPSPLDGVVVSGGAECAQCGSYQHLEPGMWTSVLPFAHGVADLAGPNPEGRTPAADVWIGDANPHRAVGLSTTFAQMAGSDLALEASPGYPVCQQCQAPRRLQLASGGVTTQCPSCGTNARYATPAQVQRWADGACFIVADEQRTDRPDVRVSQAAGLVTLACPNCGAAVRPSSGHMAECGYCHTVAFVPVRARVRGPGQLVSPVLFWMGFRGPSAARRDLEQATHGSTNVVTDAAKKTAAVFSRGLSPLPGVEQAPVRPGLDVKQLALTTALTAAALGVGYVVAVGAGWL